MCLKEFVAVLVQLICYSRLGGVDLFNGGLMLYMVLVVFSFPFLNSYLYGFLRFGMWWNSAYKSRGEWKFRTLVQFVSMTVFQVLGAWAASQFVNMYSDRWGDAVLHSVSDPPLVSGSQYEKIGVKYEPPSSDFAGYMFLEEFCAVFILLVGLLHLIGCLADKLLKNTYWAKRETPAAVENVASTSKVDNSSDSAVVPAVGEEDVDEVRTISGGGFTSKLNLIEVELKAIALGVSEVKKVCVVIGKMHSEHSNVKGNVVSGQEVVVDSRQSGDVVKEKVALGDLRALPAERKKRDEKVLPSVRSSPRAMSGSPDRDLAGMYFPNLNTGSFFMGSDMLSDKSTDNTAPPEASQKGSINVTASVEYAKQPSLPIEAIPAELILHASLLVAAISRAFPSAHQSLHLTVYLRGLGAIGDSEMFERAGGGYVACLAALAYYWFWYVYAGNAKGDKTESDGKVTRFIRRNFMDPVPAFMRGELKLPGYMRMDESML